MRTIDIRLRARHRSNSIASTVEISTEHGWVAIQEWQQRTRPETRGRKRRELMIQGAKERGWNLPLGEWPHWSADGQIILAPLHVDNWAAALRTATKARTAALARFIGADNAWRELVVAATRSWASPGAIGDAAGITRWRVYQLVRDHAAGRKGNDTRVTAGTTVQAKERYAGPDYRNPHEQEES